MEDWAIKAIEYARSQRGMSYARIQRELSDVFPAEWAIDSNRSKIYRIKDGKQPITIGEMRQLSHVTGFPVPSDISPAVDWRATVDAAIESARSAGVSAADIMSLVLAKIPVALVTTEDVSLIVGFSAAPMDSLKAADQDFSKISAR